MMLLMIQIHVQNLSHVRNETRFSVTGQSYIVFFASLGLQLFQALTKVSVNAIVTSTKKMPYGMCCIAQKMLLELWVCIEDAFVPHSNHPAYSEQFPKTTEESYAACIGLYNKVRALPHYISGWTSADYITQ